MDYQHLLCSREGAVETLTLDRPQQLNALNEQLIGELRHYFVSLAERSAVRVVVLRGAGVPSAPVLTLSHTH